MLYFLTPTCRTPKPSVPTLAHGVRMTAIRCVWAPPANRRRWGKSRHPPWLAEFLGLLCRGAEVNIVRRALRRTSRKHEKKISRVTIGVNLVPLFCPEQKRDRENCTKKQKKPLTHNNRARKKRLPESARGAEDRRTQRRRAPTTIHHVFFFSVVVVRHLRHRGLGHAALSRRRRRDDPRPSRRDLLPVVEIIRIVQRAASSPLVDAGCLLGILLWVRRRGVPRRRRTTQSNRRGR
jgi:hypothetical protein